MKRVRTKGKLGKKSSQASRPSRSKMKVFEGTVEKSLDRTASGGLQYDYASSKRTLARRKGRGERRKRNQRVLRTTHGGPKPREKGVVPPGSVYDEIVER